MIGLPDDIEDMEAMDTRDKPLYNPDSQLMQIG